jgi:hypothetical protein
MTKPAMNKTALKIAIALVLPCWLMFHFMATALADGPSHSCCEADYIDQGGGCSSDLTCQTCVCSIDSYCCDYLWDITCVEEAENPAQCFSDCTCAQVTPSSTPTPTTTPTPTITPTPTPTPGPAVSSIEAFLALDSVSVAKTQALVKYVCKKAYETPPPSTPTPTPTNTPCTYSQCYQPYPRSGFRCTGVYCSVDSDCWDQLGKSAHCDVHGEVCPCLGGPPPTPTPTPTWARTIRAGGCRCGDGCGDGCN